MTLIEAAKQALEALETCVEDEWYTDDDYGMVQTYDEEKVYAAITALRTAIAEAEKQEPVAIALNTGTKQGVKWLKNVEHGENLYTTPPAQQAQPATVQEAVAWPCEIEEADFEQDTITLKMLTSQYVVRAGKHWLSTTPPAAQRTWVGLTDEQINQYDYQYRDLLYDAEKMLRENNA